MNPSIDAALGLVGLEVEPWQMSLLSDLRDWLGTEAIEAGGIGPGESKRIDVRHLADSIIYASAWPSPPRECWDLGTGVGLPGLVLAILWPNCAMRLIDRSTRRIDLVRRAVRILGLEVEATATKIEDLTGSVEAIVSRAAIPAADLLVHLRRTLAPGGLAVVSGSGRAVAGYDELVIPAGILEHAPRLLMMRP